jgi:crotonobetainyl-CoA:carnitine CoA-transferase CaiB-like acyl-CoA transferase
MEAKKKGNGLAITALVLSAVFFLPVIPFFGLVLGIIALATGRSKPISIVAVCLGAFFTLMTGVYAAIAIPAFMKYMRRSKTVEATMNTRVLAEAVARLSAQQWSALAESDWTPPGRACDHPNGKFPADATAFAGEPWTTIGFGVSDPHYYQYRVRRDADGFVAEARGDLDCDGKFSLFRRAVKPDGAGPLFSESDLE